MASSVSSGWPGSGASPLPQNRVPIEKSLQWNLLSGIWPPAKLTELCSGQPQHGQVAQLLHFTSAHLHFLVLCPWVCAVWGQTWHRRQGCSLLPRGWGCENPLEATASSFWQTLVCVAFLCCPARSVDRARKSDGSGSGLWSVQLQHVAVIYVPRVSVPSCVTGGARHDRLQWAPGKHQRGSEAASLVSLMNAPGSWFSSYELCLASFVRLLHHP